MPLQSFRMSDLPHKLRIVSDGTRHGTHVYSSETGEDLRGVIKRIVWTLDAAGPGAEVTITFAAPAAELEGEVEAVLAADDPDDEEGDD